MIKNADLDWLDTHYPGVVYIPTKNVLRGCLWFRMIYYPADGVSVIDPDKTTNFERGIFIEDAYDLDIEFDNMQSMAAVKETTGRLKQSAKKWGKTLADIHVYSDSSLCLCPKPEEKLRFSNGFNLRDFFNSLLIPCLFYQSYFERYGKEPWKGSSHNDLGILESYDKQLFKEAGLDDVVSCYLDSLSSSLVNLVATNKKVTPNLLCICGSTNKFQSCHELAFNGLQKICRDYWLVKAGRF